MIVIHGKFTPPDGQTLLILGQDLGAIGGLPEYDDGYVNHIPVMPGGLTTYTGLHDLAGIKQLANWGSGDLDAQLLMDEPQYASSVLVIGLYIAGGNEVSAANGDHDAHIDELGEWIKAQDRPVFLRIGYEFDGSWNAHDPEAYVTAFRRIVDRFAELDVTNCATVWQSATDSSGRYGGYDWLDWYPGDEYVDWFGMTYFVYNAGIFDAWLDLAREHGKPVMIAESTPRGFDLDETDSPEVVWNHWFARYFEFIHENADVIRAVAYINVDWDSQPMWASNPIDWGDSRVQVNAMIKEQWLAEIMQDMWLHARSDLFEALSHSSGE